MTSHDLPPEVLFSRLVSRLRLRHLRLIASLEQCQSLGAAAAEVGMSQPAASQMLRELEALVGMRLYERHNRGLRPTGVARILSEHASLTLRNLQRATEAMAAQSAGREPVLHIGAIPAGVTGLLASRLARLREALPGTRFSILEENPAHLLAQLGAGALQVAIVRQPAGGVMPEFLFRQLRRDRLAIVVAPHHPEAGRRGRIRLDQLSAYPWSMSHPSQPSGAAALEACARAGFEPIRSQLRSISRGLLGHLLADGLSVAALPHSLVEDSLLTGQMVELRLHTPIELVPLGAMYAQQQLTPTLERFLAVLESPPRRR